MKTSITRLAILWLLVLVAMPVAPAQEPTRPATQPPAQDQARGPGMGAGRGMGMDQGHRQDMQTIHALFDGHQKITRTVTTTPDGVITLTESKDPAVQALIVAHAQAMKKRLEDRRPIRDWDPLFAAIFANAAKIRMEVIPTELGVKVVETSADPAVVRLIQAHADGVTEFVREGAAVMHKRHDLK